MIKFFRRIRQRLLSENRFSKYLIYAIGEIALVIIGILIALNINSRAELKKTEAKIDKLFENVLVELESGIESTTELAKDYAFFDSIFYKVWGNKLTIDDYKDRSHFNLFNLNTRILGCRLDQDAFDNLMLNRDDIPTKYEHITKELIDLYNWKATVDIYDQKMNEIVYRNLTERAEKYEWSSLHLRPWDNPGFIDYLLNDFRYKNEVQLYYTYAIHNHLKHALRYREYAIDAYKKVSELLQNPKQPQGYKVEKDLAQRYIGKWYYPMDNDSIPPLYLEYEMKDNRLYEIENRNDTIYRNELMILSTKNNFVRGILFNMNETPTYQSMRFNTDSLFIQRYWDDVEYAFVKNNKE